MTADPSINIGIAFTPEIPGEYKLISPYFNPVEYPNYQILFKVGESIITGANSEGEISSPLDPEPRVGVRVTLALNFYKRDGTRYKYREFKGIGCRIYNKDEDSGSNIQLAGGGNFMGLDIRGGQAEDADTILGETTSLVSVAGVYQIHPMVKCGDQTEFSEIPCTYCQIRFLSQLLPLLSQSRLEVQVPGEREVFRALDILDDPILIGKADFLVLHLILQDSYGNPLSQAPTYGSEELTGRITSTSSTLVVNLSFTQVESRIILYPSSLPSFQSLPLGTPLTMEVNVTEPSAQRLTFNILLESDDPLFGIYGGVEVYPGRCEVELGRVRGSDIIVGRGYEIRVILKDVGGDLLPPTTPYKPTFSLGSCSHTVISSGTPSYYLILFRCTTAGSAQTLSIQTSPLLSTFPTIYSESVNIVEGAEAPNGSPDTTDPKTLQISGGESPFNYLPGFIREQKNTSFYSLTPITFRWMSTGSYQYSFPGRVGTYTAHALLGSRVVGVEDHLITAANIWEREILPGGDVSPRGSYGRLDQGVIPHSLAIHLFKEEADGKGRTRITSDYSHYILLQYYRNQKLILEIHGDDNGVVFNNTAYLYTVTIPVSAQELLGVYVVKVYVGSHSLPVFNQLYTRAYGSVKGDLSDLARNHLTYIDYVTGQERKADERWDNIEGVTPKVYSDLDFPTFIYHFSDFEVTGGYKNYGVKSDIMEAGNTMGGVRMTDISMTSSDYTVSVEGNVVHDYTVLTGTLDGGNDIWVVADFYPTTLLLEYYLNTNGVGNTNDWREYNLSYRTTDIGSNTAIFNNTKSIIYAPKNKLLNSEGLAFIGMEARSNVGHLVQTHDINEVIIGGINSANIHKFKGRKTGQYFISVNIAHTDITFTYGTTNNQIWESSADNLPGLTSTDNGQRSVDNYIYPEIQTKNMIIHAPTSSTLEVGKLGTVSVEISNEGDVDNQYLSRHELLSFISMSTVPSDMRDTCRENIIRTNATHYTLTFICIHPGTLTIKPTEKFYASDSEQIITYSTNGTEGASAAHSYVRISASQITIDTQSTISLYLMDNYNNPITRETNNLPVSIIVYVNCREGPRQSGARTRITNCAGTGCVELDTSITSHSVYRFTPVIACSHSVGITVGGEEVNCDHCKFIVSPGAVQEDREHIRIVDERGEEFKEEGGKLIIPGYPSRPVIMVRMLDAEDNEINPETAYVGGYASGYIKNKTFISLHPVGLPYPLLSDPTTQQLEEHHNLRFMLSLTEHSPDTVSWENWRFNASDQTNMNLILEIGGNEYTKPIIIRSTPNLAAQFTLSALSMDLSPVTLFYRENMVVTATESRLEGEVSLRNILGERMEDTSKISLDFIFKVKGSDTEFVDKFYYAPGCKRGTYIWVITPTKCQNNIEPLNTGALTMGSIAVDIVITENGEVETKKEFNQALEYILGSGDADDITFMNSLPLPDMKTGERYSLEFKLLDKGGNLVVREREGEIIGDLGLIISNSEGVGVGEQNTLYKVNKTTGEGVLEVSFIPKVAGLYTIEYNHRSSPVPTFSVRGNIYNIETGEWRGYIVNPITTADTPLQLHICPSDQWGNVVDMFDYVNDITILYRLTGGDSPTATTVVLDGVHNKVTNNQNGCLDWELGGLRLVGVYVFRVYYLDNYISITDGVGEIIPGGMDLTHLKIYAFDIRRSEFLQVHTHIIEESKNPLQYFSYFLELCDAFGNRLVNPHIYNVSAKLAQGTTNYSIFGIENDQSIISFTGMRELSISDITTYRNLAYGNNYELIVEDDDRPAASKLTFRVQLAASASSANPEEASAANFKILPSSHSTFAPPDWGISLISASTSSDLPIHKFNTSATSSDLGFGDLAGVEKAVVLGPLQGMYSVLWTAHAIINAKDNITYEGIIIPHEIEVNVSPGVTASCTLDISTNIEKKAGDLVSLPYTCIDYCGNTVWEPMFGGLVTLSHQINPDEYEFLHPLYKLKMGDQSGVGVLNPRLAEDYEIRVLGGVAITPSITIVPGEPSPYNILYHIADPILLRTQNLDMKVQLMDAYNNIVGTTTLQPIEDYLKLTSNFSSILPISPFNSSLQSTTQMNKLGPIAYNLYLEQPNNISYVHRFVSAILSNSASPPVISGVKTYEYLEGEWRRVISNIFHTRGDPFILDFRFFDTYMNINSIAPRDISGMIKDREGKCTDVNLSPRFAGDAEGTGSTGSTGSTPSDHVIFTPESPLTTSYKLLPSRDKLYISLTLPSCTVETPMQLYSHIDYSDNTNIVIGDKVNTAGTFSSVWGINSTRKLPLECRVGGLCKGFFTLMDSGGSRVVGVVDTAFFDLTLQGVTAQPTIHTLPTPILGTFTTYIKWETVVSEGTLLLGATEIAGSLSIRAGEDYERATVHPEGDINKTVQPGDIYYITITFTDSQGNPYIYSADNGDNFYAKFSESYRHTEELAAEKVETPINGIKLEYTPTAQDIGELTYLIYVVNTISKEEFVVLTDVRISMEGWKVESVQSITASYREYTLQADRTPPSLFYVLMKNEGGKCIPHPEYLGNPSATLTYINGGRSSQCELGDVVEVEEGNSLCSLFYTVELGDAGCRGVGGRYLLKVKYKYEVGETEVEAETEEEIEEFTMLPGFIDDNKVDVQLLWTESTPPTTQDIFNYRLTFKDSYDNPTTRFKFLPVTLELVRRSNTSILLDKSAYNCAPNMWVQEVGQLTISCRFLLDVDYEYTPRVRFGSSDPLYASSTITFMNTSADVKSGPGPCDLSKISIGVLTPQVKMTIMENIKTEVKCRDSYGNIVKDTKYIDVRGVVLPFSDSLLQDVSSIAVECSNGTEESRECEWSTTEPGIYQLYILWEGRSSLAPLMVEIKGTVCSDTLPYKCSSSGVCVGDQKLCFTGEEEADLSKCMGEKKYGLCKRKGEVAQCAEQGRWQCEECSVSGLVKDLTFGVCINSGGIEASNVLETRCQEGEYINQGTPCGSSRVCPISYYMCPDQTCVINEDHCSYVSAVDEDSLPSAPPKIEYTQGDIVRCWDLSLAPNSQSCPSRVVCPSGQVVCPDHSCVENEGECKEPRKCMGGLVLCASGDCAPTKTDCPHLPSCGTLRALSPQLGCVSDTLGKSTINTSRILATEGENENENESTTESTESTGSGTPNPLGKLSCPAGRIKCNDGSCKRAYEDCASTLYCPPGLIKCEDSSCKLRIQDCPQSECSQGEFKCWDNSCVKDYNLCPTGITCPETNPKLCHDLTCRGWDECPEYIGCPIWSPFRCGNGECRDSPTNCPTLSRCPDNYLKCADGSCVSQPSLCQKVDMFCVEEGYINCPGDGSCRISRSLCPSQMTCPPGMFRSWTGLCLTSLPQLPTPDESESPKIMCTDGSWRGKRRDCPTETLCPLNKPVKCWDGECKENILSCPKYEECPGTEFVRCPDGICVQQATQCGTGVTCPVSSPVKCYDHTCKKDPRDCPPIPSCSSTVPFLCPTGVCHKSLIYCEPLYSCSLEKPTKCPDHQCYPDSTWCLSFQGCPSTQTMCNDGSCKYKYSDCPAEECPHSLPYLCPDGMCAFEEILCNSNSTGCPSARPYKCSNGLCIKSPADCPTLGDCSNPLYFHCPDGSCAITYDMCPSVFGCPKERPFRCYDSSCINLDIETCNRAKCPSSTPYKCPDGQCVNTVAQCPYTAKEFTQNCLNSYGATEALSLLPCADGICVPNNEQCPPLFDCPSNYVRCADRSCRIADIFCPLTDWQEEYKTSSCPEGLHIRCPNGLCAKPKSEETEAESEGESTGNNILREPEMCSAHLTEGCPWEKCSSLGTYGLCTQEVSTTVNTLELLCKIHENEALYLGNGCPHTTPLKCWSGECLAEGSTCPLLSGCPNEPFMCPDGSCVNSLSECGREENCESSTTRCPDGTCARDYKSCKSVNGCPVMTPFKCPDSKCSPYPFSPKAYVNPTSNISEGCHGLAVCPDEQPFLCSDGSCKGDPSYCMPRIPCAPGEGRCPSGECTNTSTGNGAEGEGEVEAGGASTPQQICFPLNSFACPTQAPLLCTDGRCVDSLTKCRPMDRAKCAPSAPFRCATGLCVNYYFECVPEIWRYSHIIPKSIDSATASTTDTPRRILQSGAVYDYLDQDERCSEGYKFLCSDGSCALTPDLCITFPEGCFNPYFPYKCRGGCCTEQESDCNSKCPLADKKCEDGSSLSIDGICRKDGNLLRYNGCPPLNEDGEGRPYHCPNGYCARTLEECAGISDCPLDRPFKCFNTLCVREFEDCPRPPRSYKRDRVSINPTKEQTVDFIIDDKSMVLARVYIPSNTHGADSPHSTLLLNSIPDSKLLDYTLEMSTSQEKAFRQKFQYGYSDISQYLYVVSSVIEISVVPASSSLSNHISVELWMGIGDSNTEGRTKEVCLGRVLTESGIWECHSYNAQRDKNGMLLYTTNQTGIYALLYKIYKGPKDPKDLCDSWSCKHIREFMFVVFGSLFIILVITFGLWCTAIQMEKYRLAEKDNKLYGKSLSNLDQRIRDPDLDGEEAELMVPDGPSFERQLDKFEQDEKLEEMRDFEKMKIMNRRLKEDNNRLKNRTEELGDYSIKLREELYLTKLDIVKRY